MIAALGVFLILASAAARSAEGAFISSSSPSTGSPFVASHPAAAAGKVGFGPLSAAPVAGESEAEALLRKARELAAEAAAAEETLRASLCDKKVKLDAETDAFVDRIFPRGADDGDSGLVDRLRGERPSTNLLGRVIERLHEREIAARGHRHVESSSDSDHTKFEVVAERDEAELTRVEGLIDRIIDAAAVLDRERLDAKAAKGEGGVRHHAEVMHWTEGNVAKVLRDKASDLRREHDEQFQKRLKSFYDAAKKKDLKNKSP